MRIGIKLGYIVFFSKYHDSYILKDTSVIENKILWSRVTSEGLGMAEVGDFLG